MNKKRKGPGFEDYYLIVFPDDEEGGKALDLLSEEGPVHGVLYEDQPCTVASESQLKRLTRAGIKWSYATGGENGSQTRKPSKANREGTASVRSARHHS
jgi:hypothetical protein